MAPREEETEKRLIGAALGANQMIVLDNVTRLVQGDFLNQVSEQAMLKLRPLGTSALVTVPNTFVCVIDGNNLTVADDMVRRCVQCRLDANVAEPERREFAFDPMERVAADRGHYIAACLTIVLAYVAAGSPGRLSAPASYREWSNRVRSALVWLGEDDPLVTVEELREDDPGRHRRFDVFQAWSELNELVLHEEGLRTRELIAVAQGSSPLHEALLTVAAGHGVNSDKIDVKRLGHWLKSQVGAIAAGVKLVVDRGDKQRPRWRLHPA